MPVVIPFAVGVAVGVCVAPSVRKHPKLQNVFVAVDAFTETVKDAYLHAKQAVSTMACLNHSQSIRLYSAN